MFSCQVPFVSCQHMLCGDTSEHTVIFFPAVQPGGKACLIFPSHHGRVWGSVWASEYKDATQDKWHLFSTSAQFQDSACSRFESYVRSQCHFLVPLILSPATPSKVAEVAGWLVLKECVLISPWDKSSLDGFSIFVPTENMDKDMPCTQSQGIFCVFDAMGGNWMLPGLGR